MPDIYYRDTKSAREEVTDILDDIGNPIEVVTLCDEVNLLLSEYQDKYGLSEILYDEVETLKELLDENNIPY